MSTLHEYLAPLLGGAEGTEATDVEAAQVADAPAPLPVRIRRGICEVLRLLAMQFLGLCVLLCLPLLLCCCCFLPFLLPKKPFVVLDGTKPPTLGNEARDRIDSARAVPLSMRLESFASQMESFRTGLSRTLTNTLFRAGSSLPSGLAQVASDAGMKRESLKQAQLEACKKRLQVMPWQLVIRVQRDNALKQSLACLGAAGCADLMAQNLHVNFVGETGVDAGGLARDWFDILGRGLVQAAESGDGHLMVLPDKTLVPRPYDTRFTDLYAIGRLVGLALWFGVPLPIPLGSVTCKLMLDMPISPVDLQRLDPDFVQFRVKPVLRPSGVSELEAALGEPLTFMSAATELRASKELCPGGETRRVTEENKLEYLRLLVEHHLCGDMQEQIKVLLEGFWDIFPKDGLTSSGLSHRELALLISGYPDLDPDDWRSNTTLNSSGHDELMSWFWDMVQDMSAEERAKLLHFTTGSSHLPASGFAGMSPKFNISVEGDETQHLPQAHTCGNQLVLPSYKSKDMLVEKMNIALANDEGFGFA